MRHEGLPLRGKGAADLPATVRAVTLAQCSGKDVLAFWQAMGFQLGHEMLQEGHLYVLSHVIQLQVWCWHLPCAWQVRVWTVHVCGACMPRFVSTAKSHRE